MEPTLAAALLGIVVIGGVAGPDEVTSVEADMSVDDNIRDWKASQMLDPSNAATLDVFVCPEHLPVGSPTRINLEAAIAEWNDLQGVQLFGTVRSLPGTWFHPLSKPKNFVGVYVDYDDLDDGAAAQMSKEACGISLDKDPAQCDRLYLDLDSSKYAQAMANPSEVDRAVAKRVFAHELAHGWGMGHPAPDDFDPQNSVATIEMDGASNHGDKYHEECRAWPTTVGTAKDYAWMRHYYPSAALGDLGVDELIVHPIMSLALTEDVTAELTFWRGYVRGQISNWDHLNQTSVYWSPAAKTFLRCSDDAVEHEWMARFSEVSTNTTDTTFSVGYRLSTNNGATTWATLTEYGGVHSHLANTEFNQKTYLGDFTLDATNTGINPAKMAPTVERKLQFVADLYGNVVERSEGNNVLEATLCFFKNKGLCGTCDQSTQGSAGVGEPCFDDDDCEGDHCEWSYGENGLQKLCNEVDCGECEFDGDPTDGTCDHNPLADGHPGTCDEPELCMRGACTIPGTCGGGACAPDCSIAAGPLSNNCSPGFRAAGYCPNEASCAGGQFNCDCVP